jgi:hypothetical protein
MIEWAESLGIPKKRLAQRLHYGWTVEEALTPRKLNKHNGRRLLAI